MQENQQQSEQNQAQGNSNSLEQYLKPYRLPDNLKQHKVKSNCQLREYIITELNYPEFRRGHTYFEFTNDVENILKGKKVLLQDKQNSEKWFSLFEPEELAQAANIPNLYGEGIPRDRFGEQYRVFIQSFGSGDRYLPQDSRILYKDGDQVQD